VLAADALEGDPGVRLLENRNDPGFSEPRLFHQSLLVGLFCQKSLPLTCQSTREAFEMSFSHTAIPDIL